MDGLWLLPPTALLVALAAIVECPLIIITIIFDKLKYKCIILIINVLLIIIIQLLSHRNRLLHCISLAMFISARFGFIIFLLLSRFCADEFQFNVLFPVFSFAKYSLCDNLTFVIYL